MTKAALANYAFISLGANLPGNSGNAADTIKQVLPRLQELSDSTLLTSPLYQSDPKDCPPGSPVYINAVTALLPRSGLTPESLLATLQQLEAEFGRIRSGLLNEARTLDLDLLSFHDEARNTSTLILPHPRAHERRFVLEPWKFIAGPAFKLNGASLEHWLSVCTDPPLQQL